MFPHEVMSDHVPAVQDSLQIRNFEYVVTWRKWEDDLRSARITLRIHPMLRNVVSTEDEMSNLRAAWHLD